MSTMNTPLEIYKLLNKSNCQKCLLPSCMAFSVAVIQGNKQLADCPELDSQTIESIGAVENPRKTVEDEQQQTLNTLLQQVTAIDFSSVAERLGGVIDRDKLAITCLGKDFRIDNSGNMTSECHNNQWVHIPLLSYIVHGKGVELSGNWVPFHTLKGAVAWSRFFTHRCEDELRRLADAHRELFFELLDVFGAKKVAYTDADYSLVIHPLPKLPLMIQYWVPEDDFDSKMCLHFDKSASDNINIEYIYTLTRGIVEMFRLLIVKHNMTGKLF